MRVSSRVAALLMTLACLLPCGCDQVPFVSDAPALARAQPEQPDSARAQKAGELTAKVAFELARTQQELRVEYPRPRRWKTRACPDANLAGFSEQERTLMLTSQDARLDQRHVLPLRVLDPLSSHELRRWREKHAPGVNEFTGWHAVRFEDPDLAATALEQLLAVKRRPLMGVYHVLDFRKPRWIRKPDRLKPEWIRGKLYAWLVVYDLRTHASLCQVQVAVRNDVKNASLRVRMRSDTRNSLITQLGERLRERTAPALGKISRVLRVPQD